MKKTQKFYLGVLIFFMLVFIAAAVVMFVSPQIPLWGALIYSGVTVFIETLCFKYARVIWEDIHS